MMMDVLTCKKRHVFCNLLEDHQKKNDQDGVATESKGVEYTPSKLYENKTRA